MPINERNIEISGELVTDINEDTGKTEAYFILKFIIDLHNKKVHVFDVDAMKKGHLIQLFRVLLADELEQQDLEQLSEKNLFQSIKDRFIGGDILIPEHGTTIKVFIGFSSIESTMKQHHITHSRQSIDNTLPLIVNELSGGDIPWAQLLISTPHQKTPLIIPK